MKLFMQYDKGQPVSWIVENESSLDVENPSGVRMPSGNELGANDNWIPGGKTSIGILEATVDKIQSGAYQVKSAF